METSRDTHLVMDGLLRQERRVFLKGLSLSVHIKERLLFLLIMVLSTFLRFYQFPSIPAGLMTDEVSAAYETYALLLHGTDRWGNPFPVYFPAWGSGQNVLLSYLNMPFIKVFGLTPFGERFSSALLSVLTIGIFYAFIKKWHGTRIALIAAFLLGTNPWNTTISRWSLESNLLPDFLLFGIAFLSYCHTSKYVRILMPFSLFFLAIAFYAYGVSIIIIPTFLVLYFGLVGLGNIWRNKLGILISFLIFFLVASPFLLFIVDNYILHKTPSIVEHLPFTVPLLISSRLAQVSAGQNMLASNAHFLISGFNAGLIWNVADGYSPLGLFSLPLVILGISCSIRRRQVHDNLFLIWLVATIPIFFLFPVNVTRANAIYLPLIALSAIGISGLYDSIDKKKRDEKHGTPASDDHGYPQEFPTYASAIASKVAVISLVLVASSIYNGLFCFYYFGNYNNDIKSAFNAGFDIALMQARSSASTNEPIYVSDQIGKNYVYTLFFLKADPVDFQKHARVVISGGTYKVLYYRKYYFYPYETELTSAPSFVAILKDNERLNCGYRVVLYSEGDWTVVRYSNCRRD